MLSVSKVASTYAAPIAAPASLSLSVSRNSTVSPTSHVLHGASHTQYRGPPDNAPTSRSTASAELNR